MNSYEGPELNAKTDQAARSRGRSREESLRDAMQSALVAPRAQADRRPLIEIGAFLRVGEELNEQAQIRHVTQSDYANAPATWRNKIVPLREAYEIAVSVFGGRDEYTSHLRCLLWTAAEQTDDLAELAGQIDSPSSYPNRLKITADTPKQAGLYMGYDPSDGQHLRDFVDDALRLSDEFSDWEQAMDRRLPREQLFEALGGYTPPADRHDQPKPPRPAAAKGQKKQTS